MGLFFTGLSSVIDGSVTTPLIHWRDEIDLRSRDRHGLHHVDPELSLPAERRTRGPRPIVARLHDTSAGINKPLDTHGAAFEVRSNNS